jgi:hypothetical protein
MSGIGHRTWVVPGGRNPPGSRGLEPEFTSRDELSLLNTGETPAEIRLTVYFENRDPAGPFGFEVGSGRVRTVRITDLIDPEAIPLGVGYAVVVVASVPVVVQHFRLDTRPGAGAMFSTLAFPA